MTCDTSEHADQPKQSDITQEITVVRREDCVEKSGSSTLQSNENKRADPISATDNGAEPRNVVSLNQESSKATIPVSEIADVASLGNSCKGSGDKDDSILIPGVLFIDAGKAAATELSSELSNDRFLV